jgi:hypothetical protein
LKEEQEEVVEAEVGTEKLSRVDAYFPPLPFFHASISGVALLFFSQSSLDEHLTPKLPGCPLSQYIVCTAVLHLVCEVVPS